MESEFSQLTAAQTEHGAEEHIMHRIQQSDLYKVIN